MYASCEELKKNASQYAAELKAKFNGADGKKYICLCGGTGCMSGGTREIKKRFEECLENFKLKDKAEIQKLAPDYTKAINWAVAKKITTGYSSDNTFRPNKNCTRGECATFIYRQVK